MQPREPRSRPRKHTCFLRVPRPLPFADPPGRLPPPLGWERPPLLLTQPPQPRPCRPPLPRCPYALLWAFQRPSQQLGSPRRQLPIHPRSFPLRGHLAVVAGRGLAGLGLDLLLRDRRVLDRNPGCKTTHPFGYRLSRGTAWDGPSPVCPWPLPTDPESTRQSTGLAQRGEGPAGAGDTQRLV